ncbi:MAG: cupin domain-containing protein [Azospirillaceae bacterium]|nr:cupin domain-containing protein [Azospirillaceae bacterium]
MSIAQIIKIDDVKVISRGSGIETWPLVVPSKVPGAQFTTGMSCYPKGQGAPMHSHNCDEQVTLLEGQGEVEIDGVVTPLVPFDTTYITANRMHCFRNTGDAPMRILWVYSSPIVSRTFADTGETVVHLSPADLMGAEEK